MRWGVGDTASDDHSAHDLCMEGIQQCHRLSLGPFFVVSGFLFSYIIEMLQKPAKVCILNHYPTHVTLSLIEEVSVQEFIQVFVERIIHIVSKLCH